MRVDARTTRLSYDRTLDAPRRVNHSEVRFNGFSGLLSNLDDFDGTATTLPEPRLLWRVED